MRKAGKTKVYKCNRTKYNSKERIRIKQRTKERQNVDEAVCTGTDMSRYLYRLLLHIITLLSLCLVELGHGELQCRRVLYYSLCLADCSIPFLLSCVPFLRCTDSPSVAVVRCKMKGLFVVMVLIATLVSQSTAQYTCKFKTTSL